jgi:tetratricopeptide (TPR) repeat protein
VVPRASAPERSEPASFDVRGNADDSNADGLEIRNVSRESVDNPVLVGYYEQYLVEPDAAQFTRRVEELYTVATLERLLAMGRRMARRGAALAIGCLGDYSSNHVMGRALLDADRGVRTLADRGIRQLWSRVGSDDEREKLQSVKQLNDGRQYEAARRLATELLQQSPWFAEAWNQRALAHFNRSEYDEAIRDCHQTLEINPYHFPAATGMGKCYLQQGNRVAALESFRRALRLNPGLDDVRAHVVYLQRALKEE